MSIHPINPINPIVHFNQSNQRPHTSIDSGGSRSTDRTNERDGRNAQSLQLEHLIVDERHQWLDHHRDSRGTHGWQLEAQRLASSSRQQQHHMLPEHRCIDGLTLQHLESRVPKQLYDTIPQSRSIAISRERHVSRGFDLDSLERDWCSSYLTIGIDDNLVPRLRCRPDLGGSRRWSSGSRGSSSWSRSCDILTPSSDPSRVRRRSREYW